MIAIQILLIALLAGVTMPSASANEEHVTRIESVVNEYFENGKFIGSVLVAESGKPIYQQGVGMANYEWDIPNGPDTKHRLGSITKQFTSVLILQLVEKEKLRLDDTISDHLTKYRKDTGAKISIHHLLTHTSGIPNYTALPGFMTNAARDPYTVEDFTKEYCSGDLEFDPGGKMRYSNSGYFILGAILEAVTGKDYESLLHEQIFDPLGMEDSGYDRREPILKNRATGYSKDKKTLVNSAYLDMSIPYAAGSLYSTVEDLYTWDRALYGEQLLSVDMKIKMFEPVRNGYGYGWFIAGQKLDDGEMVRTVGHAGGIPGFSTMILRAPVDEHLVVVLGNNDRAQSSALAKELLEILYTSNSSAPVKD